MTLLAVTRSATGRPTADTNEVVAQYNALVSNWVLSSPTLGVSTGNATYSATKFYIAGTNAVYIQATVTGPSFSGISVTAGTYVLVAAYRTIASAHAVIAGTAGATLAAATMPIVPAGKIPYGLLLLAPTDTDFVGGTTELNATNANAVFWNLTGSAPIAVQTAQITRG